MGLLNTLGNAWRGVKSFVSNKPNSDEVSNTQVDPNSPNSGIQVPNVPNEQPNDTSTNIVSKPKVTKSATKSKDNDRAKNLGHDLTESGIDIKVSNKLTQKTNKETAQATQLSNRLDTIIKKYSSEIKSNQNKVSVKNESATQQTTDANIKSNKVVLDISNISIESEKISSIENLLKVQTVLLSDQNKILAGQLRVENDKLKSELEEEKLKSSNLRREFQEETSANKNNKSDEDNFKELDGKSDKFLGYKLGQLKSKLGTGLGTLGALLGLLGLGGVGLAFQNRLRRNRTRTDRQVNEQGIYDYTDLDKLEDVGTSADAKAVKYGTKGLLKFLSKRGGLLGKGATKALSATTKVGGKVVPGLSIGLGAYQVKHGIDRALSQQDLIGGGLDVLSGALTVVGLGGLSLAIDGADMARSAYQTEKASKLDKDSQAILDEAIKKGWYDPSSRAGGAVAHVVAIYGDAITAKQKIRLNKLLKEAIEIDRKKSDLYDKKEQLTKEEFDTQLKSLKEEDFELQKKMHRMQSFGQGTGIQPKMKDIAKEGKELAKAKVNERMEVQKKGDENVKRSRRQQLENVVMNYGVDSPQYKKLVSSYESRYGEKFDPTPFISDPKSEFIQSYIAPWHSGQYGEDYENDPRYKAQLRTYKEKFGEDYKKVSTDEIPDEVEQPKVKSDEIPTTSGNISTDKSTTVETAPINTVPEGKDKSGLFNGKDDPRFAQIIFSAIRNYLKSHNLGGNNVDNYAGYMTAQLANESGWGTKETGAFNFGGIKATKSTPDDRKTLVTTSEYIDTLDPKSSKLAGFPEVISVDKNKKNSNGYRWLVKDYFKSYPSLNDFFDDYIGHLTSGKWKVFEGPATLNNYVDKLFPGKGKNYATQTRDGYFNSLNGIYPYLGSKLNKGGIQYNFTDLGKSNKSSKSDLLRSSGGIANLSKELEGVIAASNKGIFYSNSSDKEGKGISGPSSKKGKGYISLGNRDYKGKCTSGPETFYRDGMGLNLSGYWYDTGKYSTAKGTRLGEKGFKKLWSGSGQLVRTKDQVFKQFPDLKPGDIMMQFGTNKKGDRGHAAMWNGVEWVSDTYQGDTAFVYPKDRLGDQSAQIWRFSPTSKSPQVTAGTITPSNQWGSTESNYKINTEQTDNSSKESTKEEGGSVDNINSGNKVTPIVSPSITQPVTNNNVTVVNNYLSRNDALMAEVN